MSRPHPQLSTASHPHSEVKPGRAWIVQPWGTGLEVHVLRFFFFFAFLFFCFCFFYFFSLFRSCCFYFRRRIVVRDQALHSFKWEQSNDALEGTTISQPWTCGAFEGDQTTLVGAAGDPDEEHEGAEDNNKNEKENSRSL